MPRTRCTICKRFFDNPSGRRRKCQKCLLATAEAYRLARNASLKVKTVLAPQLPPAPVRGVPKRKRLMTDAEQRQIDLAGQRLDLARMGLVCAPCRSLSKAEIEQLVAAGEITPVELIATDRNIYVHREDIA